MRLREVKPPAQSHTAISDRARTGLRVVPPANDAIPTFRTDHSRINRGESNGPHKGVSMSGPETSRDSDGGESGRKSVLPPQSGCAK